MIKQVSLIRSEWSNDVDKFVPKDFKSLLEADQYINSIAAINWKFWFRVIHSSGDTYEGSGYKSWSERVHLRRHMLYHLKHTIESNNSFVKDNQKIEAKKWLTYIS